MKPPKPCPVFSPCWCEVAGRENNPHCADAVPIEQFVNVFFIIAVIYGIFIIIKRKN